MRLGLSPLWFVKRAARIYADRIGVVDGELRLTYGAFLDRCARLAAGLRKLGVQRGDRVAVLSPNTHRALEAYHAVPLAGAVLVPLNIRLTPDEYAYILRHSGARVLLADPAYREVASALEGRVEGLRTVLLGEADGSEALIATAEADRARALWEELVDLEEDAPITLNYTSGTTAHPKGVILTHRNAALNVVNFIVHGRLRMEDVYLHTLPMFHVNGWGGVWAVTAVGARHVCLPRIDPPQVARLIDEEGVTMACSAPTVLVMLLNDPAFQTWRPRHRVRWYVGGASPPAALIARVEALGIEVVHVYGLTETGPWLTVCEARPEWEALPVEERAALKARQGVGQLLCGEVQVVREDLTPVAWDGREMGEVVVRGPTVMAGYYQDPEATAEAFAGGWFHTGDLAVVHPDGYLQVVDRKKDIIISGGENISSVEVEGVLYQHPAVLEAAVVAAPDPKWGEVPKAFVVLRPGMQATAEELIAFCRERLAHFKAPKSVEFLEALPKTATGKIQKYLLRARSG